MTWIKYLSIMCILGCAGLPKDQPENFQVQLNFDGGMRYKFYTIHIVSSGESFVESRIDGQERKDKFSLPKERLDQLYQVFIDQDFSAIQVRTVKRVYDRGGTSISLKIGDQEIEKRNRGIDFVKPPWKDNYYAVEQAIIQLVKEALKEQNIADYL